MKNVQFPSTIKDFQASLKAAIEQYQGSPVKNQNKLNECTAKALGFKNYDSLSASLKQPISVRIFSDCETIIDGETINEEIFTDRMVDYKLVHKDYFIKDIIMSLEHFKRYPPKKKDAISFLSEALTNLNKVNDVYVFTSMTSYDYIAASLDTEKFNQVCGEILSINEKIEDEFIKAIESLNGNH